MLASANRLRTRAEFSKCYQTGTTRYGEFILVKSRINQKDTSRFGIVVSKKISKSAVVRNRIKRRISEVIRTSEHLATNRDFVLVAKSNIRTSSPDALKQDIMSALAQFQGK